MDIDKIIRLLQEFSNSNLSSLKYEEGNIRIKLQNKTNRCGRGKGKSPLLSKSNHYESQVIDQNKSHSTEEEPVLVTRNQAKTRETTNEVDSHVTDNNQGIQNDVSSGTPKEDNKDLLFITSPTVGTFYKAESPESEPYIQVGDIIEKGQVIGIVEAMKVMNEIESPYRALVKEIPANDEEIVEFGQTLVVLETL